MALERSKRLISQRNVRRFGASLGLIGLALLISRYVTPSGASSPLVLLGATAAAAYFGGRWPALLATAAAAVVNGVAIGLDEIPRLAVESSMIVFLGSLLAFRVPIDAEAPEEADGPIVVEATVSGVEDAGINLPSEVGHQNKSTRAVISAPGETPRQRPDAAPPIMESATADAQGAASLLIVHGNAVLRLALRSTLAGLGYRVRDVANISQGFSLFETETFDGVVLEIGRVDDAALAAVERIRGITASDRSRKSVVFVLASVESDEDRELLQTAGADFVLKKPIDTVGVAVKVQEQFPTPDGRVQSRVGLGASP